MHRTLTCSAGSPGSIPAVGVGVKVMSNIQSHFFLLGIRWLIYIENKSLARHLTNRWHSFAFSSRMKKDRCRTICGEKCGEKFTMISFLFSASSSAEDVRLLLPSLSPRSRLLRMRGLLLQGGPGFAV